MLKKAPAETPLKIRVNANLQGGFDPLTPSQGLSWPLLCAPACRPAHLLVSRVLGIASSGCLPSRLLCSTSPRLAA
jgi:hypothetical protein